MIVSLWILTVFFGKEANKKEKKLTKRNERRRKKNKEAKN